MDVHSRGGLQILPNDPRILRSNSQQCQRRTLGSPAPLLPVAQRMHANAHGLRKLLLRQPYETPERCDIVAALERTLDQLLTQARRDGAREIVLSPPKPDGTACGEGVCESGHCSSSFNTSPTGGSALPDPNASGSCACRAAPAKSNEIPAVLGLFLAASLLRVRRRVHRIARQPPP